MGRTKIEWATSTWNPVTGCTKVSPGCKHCYAETMHKRLRAMGTPKYSQEFSRVIWHDSKSGIPGGKYVFVCSMSDLFHADVPDSFIMRVYRSMATRPNQVFIVLTKRAQRMATLLQGISRVIPVKLDHIWHGITVVNQDEMDGKTPFLLQTPSEIRFLSIEPLLGPIRVGGWGWYNTRPTDPRINWVIVGGESGHGARPMHPDWVRTIRDDCIDAKVPFFFKQWGAWKPACSVYEEDDDLRDEALDQPYKLFYPSGHTLVEHDIDLYGQPPMDTLIYHRMGKKKSGRLLDNREWNELPL